MIQVDGIEKSFRLHKKAVGLDLVWTLNKFAERLDRIFLGVAGLFFGIVVAVWNHGIRSYSSASS